MTAFMPNYTSIDTSDPEVAKKFVQYAAGYASQLAKRLDALTEGDEIWLAQFHDDPRIACDMLNRRHDLQLVTERLKE